MMWWTTRGGVEWDRDDQNKMALHPHGPRHPFGDIEDSIRPPLQKAFRAAEQNKYNFGMK